MKTLWLAVELPHLALDLVSRGKEGIRDLPLAVSDADARRPHILDCNPAASRLGIRAGLPVNAARGLAGALQIADRDPHAEQQALERLAAWCYQYSSAVSILPGRHALLLESGGSERLLGDSAALGQRLTRELLGLGYHARAGTGPTPEGALLAARRGLDLPNLKALQETLSGLPLEALLIEPSQHAALEKMGFRRVRDVLRLPRKALARRLGTGMVEYLDRLTGVRPDPQRHWIPPERFTSAMDLPAEVGNSQGLLFPLRRLIGELCGVLRAADRGVQELNIHLQLRRGEEQLQLRLQQPSRDEQHFMDLLRERLERFRLPQPACRLSLDTDEFLSFDAAPQGLFVDPDNPSSNPVEPLLERLRARLGDGSGRRPQRRRRPSPGIQLVAPSPGGAGPLPVPAPPSRLAAVPPGALPHRGLPRARRAGAHRKRLVGRARLPPRLFRGPRPPRQHPVGLSRIQTTTRLVPARPVRLNPGFGTTFCTEPGTRGFVDGCGGVPRSCPAGLEACGYPPSPALGGVGHTNHPDLGDLISPSLAK